MATRRVALLLWIGDQTVQDWFTTWLGIGGDDIAGALALLGPEWLQVMNDVTLAEGLRLAGVGGYTR